MSWLMKEILHKDNQHLDAANKIRAEAEELGFTSGYLDFGNAPVGQQLRTRLVIEVHCADQCLKENAICECHVG
jgi:hypothetical protein